MYATSFDCTNPNLFSKHQIKKLLPLYMKAGRMLRSVLILFLSYPVLILCKVTQLENCLLDGQVLYKDSEDCLSLLEQGPCDSGQQMVMDAGYKGKDIKLNIIYMRLF